MFNGINNPTGGGLSNPISSNTLIEFVEKLLNIVIQVGTPVLVVMIIWVGFKFVTARGNTNKLSEAKEALMWTLIGAAIVLGAFVISGAIQATVDQL